MLTIPDYAFHWIMTLAVVSLWAVAGYYSPTRPRRVKRQQTIQREQHAAMAKADPAAREVIAQLRAIMDGGLPTGAIGSDEPKTVNQWDELFAGDR